MSGPELSCELCGDTGKLHLSQRCHPTAPMRVELEDGVLKLFCYIPDCNRPIAQFKVAEEPC